MRERLHEAVNIISNCKSASSRRTLLSVHRPTNCTLHRRKDHCPGQTRSTVRIDLSQVGFPRTAGNGCQRAQNSWIHVTTRNHSLTSGRNGSRRPLRIYWIRGTRSEYYATTSNHSPTSERNEGPRPLRIYWIHGTRSVKNDCSKRVRLRGILSAGGQRGQY